VHPEPSAGVQKGQEKHGKAASNGRKMTGGGGHDGENRGGSQRLVRQKNTTRPGLLAGKRNAARRESRKTQKTGKNPGKRGKLDKKKAGQKTSIAALKERESKFNKGS